MVIAEDQSGLSEDCEQLSRNTSKANETVNTRKGGSQAQSAKSLQSSIIVDMREFKSELPSLIHKRGIEIVPVTLYVCSVNVYL